MCFRLRFADTTTVAVFQKAASHSICTSTGGPRYCSPPRPLPGHIQQQAPADRQALMNKLSSWQTRRGGLLNLTLVFFFFCACMVDRFSRGPSVITRARPISSVLSGVLCFFSAVSQLPDDLRSDSHTAHACLRIYRALGMPYSPVQVKSWYTAVVVVAVHVIRKCGRWEIRKGKGKSEDLSRTLPLASSPLAVVLTVEATRRPSLSLQPGFDFRAARRSKSVL